VTQQTLLYSVAEVHASSSSSRAISWLVKKLFDHTVHADSTPSKIEILSSEDAKLGSHITENIISTLYRPPGYVV
jgi:hypothetical protein